jgi:hypothetical protein
MWQALLNLLLLLALFGGTQTPVMPPPTTAPAQTAVAQPVVSGPLRDALTFSPVDSGPLSFTDWALLKRYAGAEALTGQSPEQAKLDLLMSINKTQAASSGFGLNYFRVQFEKWGWDSLDLNWEATISPSDLPPAYVLRLRDDFDFGALEQLFVQRDYVRSEHGGATLYTHPMDPSVDWRTEIAVFNAALLPEEHILIHASSPEALVAVLDAHTGALPSWASVPAYTDVAAQLGEVAAAFIAPGSALCSRLNMAGIVDLMTSGKTPTAEEVDRLQSSLFGDQPLHPYLAFGIGYRYTDGRPVGVLVFHYPNAAQAQADLAPRRQVAEQATSLATKRPYSETLFTLADAAVVDNSIVFTVYPVDDLPRRLFDMVFRQDMVFAACP